MICVSEAPYPVRWLTGLLLVRASELLAVRELKVSSDGLASLADGTR